MGSHGAAEHIEIPPEVSIVTVHCARGFFRGVRGADSFTVHW